MSMHLTTFSTPFGNKAEYQNLIHSRIFLIDCNFAIVVVKRVKHSKNIKW